MVSWGLREKVYCLGVTAKLVLKTTYTDRDNTAETLLVKLLAEKKQFSKKSDVRMPALMEIKM